jgi:hypothetical protein
MTFVESPKAGNDEPPIRPLYRMANIIVELLLVCVIGLVAGYIFTGSIEGSLRLTSPMIAAYIMLDIILLIRKGTTGFMRITLFK